MDNDLLRKVPLFEGLGEEDLEAIGNVTIPRSFDKDQVIILAEEEGDALFIISKGQVKVTIVSEDGREVILSLLGEGAVFGELSLLDGKPRSANVVATRDTELYMGMNPSSATNALGEYLIQGLPSGQVDLVAKAPHLMERKISGVEIREGARNNMDIQLEQGNSIAGHVVDQAGQPVSGARLLVRDFGAGMKELSATSSGDGSFTVEGIVAEDSVELTVTHQDFGTYNNEIDGEAGTDTCRWWFDDPANCEP